MGGFTYTFERYEMKYILYAEQYAMLINEIREHMRPDEFGKSSVYSLYFDTPDRRLIRTSLDKPDFKEKLRLRSYGLATESRTVFVELKRKFDGVVYKRRLAMSLKDALACVNGDMTFPGGQIANEINYFLSFYGDLEPSVLIMSEREAFFSSDDPTFRITLDSRISYSDKELSLEKCSYGKSLLDEGRYLLEIKTSGAMPLWTARFLSENGIYQTSFSKYGNAYTELTNKNNNRGVLSA